MSGNLRRSGQRPSRAGAVATESAIPGNVHVREIHRYDEFADLSDSWETISRHVDALGAFARFGWFDAVWQWRQRDAEPMILAVFSGKQVIGFVPLLFHGAPTLGFRMTELRFLTVPDTQFCGVIAKRDDRPTVVKAFLSWLNHNASRWSRLALTHIPGDDGDLAELKTAFEARGVTCETRTVDFNYSISLNGHWDDYYATRSRRLKKGNNLVANKLKKAGTPSLIWLRGSDIDNSILETLAALSRDSWKSETGNSLDQPGPNAFLARLLKHDQRTGQISVWLLKLDESVVAGELQIIQGGRVHALRGDFLEEYDALSPGTYLNWQIIKGLFEQQLDTYFLGPGSNAYKLRWTDQGTPLHSITAYSPTLAGRCMALLERKLKPALRHLRDRLRQTKPEGD